MPLTDKTLNFQIPKEAFKTGITDARTFNAAMDYIDDLLFRGVPTDTWKNPVDALVDLPITDPIGTARVVKADTRIYVWDGLTWKPSNEGALTYKGTWDASTNTPILSDGTGTKGYYYVVSASGTQDLGSGPISFSPGDWVVHNGLIWQKADHTDVVTSVFGRQGAVVAQAGDYTHAQLAGIGIDDHHAKSHAHNGVDGSGLVAHSSLSGIGVNDHHARDHRATHIIGGLDAFLATDLLDAVVKRLQESGGPTILTVGAIPDGGTLKRSGTGIVGDIGATYRSWVIPFGGNTSAGFNTSSSTPVVMRSRIFPGTDVFGIPQEVAVLAMSSSGNPVYIDIYRPSTGTVICTLTITALVPTIYTFTPPFTNPWPTTQEQLDIRGYRGGGAATLTAYDVIARVSS